MQKNFNKGLAGIATAKNHMPLFQIKLGFHVSQRKQFFAWLHVARQFQVGLILSIG